MPRFYFHYRDGARHRADAEGMILPDAEAAWYHAVRSARDMIDAQMRVGAMRPGLVVEIADERGEPVNAVPFDEVAGLAV